MRQPLRVLIVEDSEDDALLMVRALRQGGYDPTFERVETAEAMKAALEEKPWDAILVDYALPQFSALAALALVPRLGLDLPFIVVSGVLTVDEAVVLMKAGAHDFVRKDSLGRLAAVVERELKAAQTRQERQQAEAARRASEARYRLIADNIQDGLTLIEEGKVVHVNDRASEIFGYPRDELTKMTGLELAAPEERARLEKIRQQAQETGVSPKELECWIVRQDGTRRYIQNRYTPMRHGEQIVGRLVVTRDLTERQQAEEALRESQQLLEKTFFSLREAVFIIHAETVQILNCNPAASTLFGYGYEEMLWRTTDFLHVDEAALEEFRKHLYAAVAEKGYLSDLEFHMKRKDGTIFPTEHTVVPLLDEAGRRVAWMSVIRDITERRQAEAELKDRHEKLRALYELSQAVTASLDLSQVATLALEATLRLLNLDRGTIRYLEEATQELVPLHMLYANPEAPRWEYPGPRIKVGQDLPGLAAQTGEPVFSEDAAHDPRIVVQRDRFAGYQSVLSLPLKVRDKVVGVIGASSRQRRTFTPAEIELMTSLGNLVGLAIANARLFEHTQRQLAQQELSAKVLARLNQAGVRETLIRDIALLIREHSGGEAVGLRLQEGEDYPYYVADGFVDGHVAAENRLCAYDRNGQVLRDEAGNLVLECMCGNIIRGRFDPQQPFFTPGGSFWTNSLTELLASTTEVDRLTRLRGRCLAEGYESMALVPLRVGHENIGLLQLNDKRRGRFTPEIIAFYEELGQAIGIALSRQQAEELFYTLAEKATVGIYVTQDGKFRYANPQFQKDTGYSQKELLGQAELALVLPEDRSRVRESALQMLKGERLAPGEVRGVTKAGQTRWVEFVVSPIQYQGKRAGLGCHQDITERKGMELALRESEERYRHLFASLLDGFAYCQMLWDEQNRPVDFVYLEVNDAFEKITGLPKADVIGKKATELFPGIRERYPDLFTTYGQAALTGEEARFELYFEPLAKWLDLSVYSPRKGYFVAVFDDITERKQAEEKLRQHVVGYLERFHRALVGRELRMRELKERIKQLEGKLASRRKE